MQLEAGHYLQILQALLPKGIIWPRDPESDLGRLLYGLAEEMARVDGRAADLVDESDPTTTLELLSDFERVCGLPGKCSSGEDTVEQRRGEVLAKLTSRGGQTPAYFIELAAQLGYSVEIEEFRPFRAGSSAEDRAYGTSWAHAWRVNGPMDQFSFFTAGSFAGERLAAWGNEKLECYVGGKSPVHTTLLFGYYAFVATEGGEILTTEDSEDLIL